MQIYVDLIYNNIESFLANTFRVVRAILADDAWHELVRDFVHRHASSSPFFQEIPLEFLAFLGEGRSAANDPPFLLELAHYEWVELALDLDCDEVPESNIVGAGDLLAMHPVVSPLAWLLSYRYPVHRIGAGYQPETAPDEPTFLIVYRGRDDRVRFLEANRVTARLIQLLEADGNLTGQSALEQIAAELESTEAGFQRDDVLQSGRETLEHLADCAIIAGVRVTG